MLMAKNYVIEFITRNPTATIMNIEDEHIHFNNLSRSKLMIGLSRDREKMEKVEKITADRERIAAM